MENGKGFVLCASVGHQNVVATPTADFITVAISWIITFNRLFAKKQRLPICTYNICVITLVTLLWLNQEPHTKWCFCFGSHSAQSFKYVESICADSGHYYWVKMNTYNIYIYIYISVYTLWYDTAILYCYLHCTITSIIMHIYHWGM